MDDSSPLSNAAIVFPCTDPGSTDEVREYWPAHTLPPSGPHKHGASIDAPIDAISFSALNGRARRCANRIESQLDGLRGKRDTSIDDCSADSQPIVAIAIPEGPALPTTVLALHMIQMRHYKSNSTSSLSKVPILLPIDPDEPPHRLRQILEDAPPDCMVCAADKDTTKMNGAVSAVSELSTTILNINDLLEDGAKDDDIVDDDSVYPWPPPKHSEAKKQVVSHICFTSGTSGRPKGCTSSLPSLLYYLDAKNKAHGIDSDSVVFLASSICFDPCFSDILATLAVGATLAIAPRNRLYNDFASCLAQTKATHVLCTPTLWSTVSAGPSDFANLEVVALGGERIPKRIVKRWARKSDVTTRGLRLLATYGTTEACVYQTYGEVFFVENNHEASPRQDVGLPLAGNIVRICHVPEGETFSAEALLNDVAGTDPSNGVGEVVLAGSQLDCISGYWGRPDLTKGVFVECSENSKGVAKRMHYRTGDLGYVDENGH